MNTGAKMNVKGGIVNSEIWSLDKEIQTCRQVLFIFKEAPVRKDFDLIRHLKGGGGAATYAGVAMWTYLLRHYGLSPSPITWKVVNSKKEKREQNLQHIAVLNINDNYTKRAEGKHSNDKLLFEEYNESRHRAIERAVQQISPSVIVTGGKVVTRCLKKYANLSLIVKRPYVSAYQCILSDSTYILFSIPHPNASIKRTLIFQDMLSVLRCLPSTLTFQ